MSRFLCLLILASLLALSAVSAHAARTINFRAHVLPIIEARCIDCHGTPEMRNGRLREPKGGLRLDSAEAIMKGGDAGEVVVPLKPNESTLHTLTTLNKGHDDIMPAKGDPLTKTQQRIIRIWIEEGANFDGWKGNTEDATETPRPEPAAKEATATPAGGPSIYDRLAERTNAAIAADIEAVKTIGGQVRELVEGRPLLRVEFISTSFEVGDRELEALDGLRLQLVQLDLSRSQVSDQGMRTLSSLKKVVWLDLHNTEIGDRGLGELRNLPELRYLNLHSTEISDSGVSYLQQMENLEEVYLYNTRVSPDAIDRLKAFRPDLKIGY